MVSADIMINLSMTFLSCSFVLCVFQESYKTVVQVRKRLLVLVLATAPPEPNFFSPIRFSLQDSTLIRLNLVRQGRDSHCMPPHRQARTGQDEDTARTGRGQGGDRTGGQDEERGPG